MTFSESLNLLGLSETSDDAAIVDAVKRYEERLQERLESAESDEELAVIERSLVELQTAQAVLADRPKAAVRASLLSLTQQRDLPVKSLPAVADGLSQTQARDLPQRELSVTDTPRGRGDTDGDRDAPDGGLGLKPGDTLAQRYEIRALIGRGGMGAVFATFDRVRNEEVAVKVLLPHLLKDPQARERFTNEAKIASSLSHPNIVRVFDLQEDGANSFLTMELLQGTSLREEITKRQAKSQRFTVDEVRRIGEQLCDALSHAHKQTIHRDVKPENIWLCEDGTLKLMDFGIARLLRPSQFTSLGLGMGTAYYMAPEQLKAQKEIDHRADQYAVGVILYELLTGEIPQGAIQAPHEVRRNLPEGLSLGVMRTLSGNADKRFSDMAGLRQVLRAPQPAFKFSRLAVAAALVAIIAGIAGTYPLWITPVQKQWKLQTSTESKSLAMQARAKAERAQLNWQNKSADLSTEPPTLAVEAQERWQAGEAALVDLDFPAATNEFTAAALGYDDATRALVVERAKMLESGKLLEVAQDKLKEMAAPRGQWQRLSKNLPPDEIPAIAIQADEAYIAAQENAVNLATLQSVGAHVAEAVQGYEEAVSIVTKRRLAEMAEAKSRVKLALDEAQNLLNEMRQAVKSATQSLVRAQQQKKLEEITQIQIELGTAKRFQEAFESHPHATGWFDEASGALAAGDALTRDDLLAARAKYEQGESAARKLVLWLTHAPKALAETHRLQPVVAAKVKDQADPRASLYAWPHTLLDGAIAKIQEADPRLAVVEVSRVDEALEQLPNIIAGRLFTLAYQDLPHLQDALTLVSERLSQGDTSLRAGRLEEARTLYQDASNRYQAIGAVAKAGARIDDAERASRLIVKAGSAADLYAWPRLLLSGAPAKILESDPGPAFDLAKQVEVVLPKIDLVLKQRPEALTTDAIPANGNVAVAIAEMKSRLEEGDAALRGGKLTESEGLYQEAFRLMPFLKSPFSATSAGAKQRQMAAELGGQASITNSVGMRLTLIPPGEFLMGAPLTESDRDLNEIPHPVRISAPFYLGTYEVTQSEFQRVTGRNPSWFTPDGGGKNTLLGQDTGKFPVERVSWYDAVEFCNQLSKRDGLPEFYTLDKVSRKGGVIVAAKVTSAGGRGYRLPTEAEWEYACRAGTVTPFVSGNVFGGRDANINGKYPYGSTTAGVYLRRTTTVGSYGANAFGLYDMHGNVWEWCSDSYAREFEPQPAIDPPGPNNGVNRVLRGGSWLDYAALARSAYRFRAVPEFNVNHFGFRVARNP